jgi:protein N-terminal methyltransferase
MGAGVGRVVEHVLSKEFAKTDLLEPLPHFMQKARQNLEKCADKIGTYYETGMEKFEFDKKYDLIWFQWVIGHLTDSDLVTFLQRCKENLKPGVKRAH